MGPGGRTTGPSRDGPLARAHARAAAKARALAGMPITGVGGFGARLAGFGGTAADRAGGGPADPGARYEGAVGQAGSALLALLKGASPTAPYDRALRHSAREAAKAKAGIGATQALFDVYGLAARRDAGLVAGGACRGV